MIEVVEIVLVVVAFPMAMVGAQRIAHGSKVGVNPLAAFTATWVLAGLMYLLNPLGLTAMPIEAQLAVIASVACFATGYVTACRAYALNRYERAGAEAVPLQPLRRVLGLTVVLGGLLFVVFLDEIGFSGLLTDPAAVLLNTRLALNEGSVPTGFYFFYFFELAVPVAVVLWYFRRRRIYWVVAVVATGALVTTTGRTNVFDAIVWATVALLILRGSARVTKKQALGGAAGLLLAFGVFIVVGEALGKNFSNSALSHEYGNVPPVLDAFVVPLYYLTGPLPTFGAVVADPTSVTGAGLTFRPLLQLLNLVNGSVGVPSKIEQFYFVPTPFNLATYLGPLWHDGGMVAVVVGSVFTGAVCGLGFSLWLRHRTPATLLLAGFVTIVALNTIKDSSLNEISTLFQVGLLVWCIQAERSRGSGRVRAPGDRTLRSVPTRRRAS